MRSPIAVSSALGATWPRPVCSRKTRHVPAELAVRYNVEGIDEVVILDVTATLEGRRALAATVSAVAKRIFIPLTVGGGIRTEDDAAAAIDAGAEKVSLNTAALNNPELITRLAARYGSQAAVVAIDVVLTRLAEPLLDEPAPAGVEAALECQAVLGRTGVDDLLAV
mgnify:CR=1 FL=1